MVANKYKMVASVCQEHSIYGRSDSVSATINLKVEFVDNFFYLFKNAIFFKFYITFFSKLEKLSTKLIKFHLYLIN